MPRECLATGKRLHPRCYSVQADSIFMIILETVPKQTVSYKAIRNIHHGMDSLPSTMTVKQESAAVVDGENTDLSFFAHSSQNSCADVQNGAFSCNSDGEQASTENPVFTGVLTNKHGDLSEKEMVPRARIELATRGFSVRCSTN